MTKPMSGMKGVVAVSDGGPEVLQCRVFPMPSIAADGVLIKVAAAGINRADIIQRRGKYDPPDDISSILGLEVAGKVVAVGADVTQFMVGDKVCALLAGGGYAEYAAAPEGQCLPWPENMSAVEAACLPEGVFTVWANVFEDAQLKAGETVLVHGGGSGIGTTAIQMIKAAGGKAIVTVGSEDKAKACMDLGAELAIDYPNQDFVEVVKKHTAGRGVDIVLDMVGGLYVQRNIDCMAEFGRHVSIATIRGMKVELNIRDLMRKRLRLSGSTLRPRSVEEKTRLRDEILAHVWPWVKEGKLKPLIFQTFPLEKAEEAHKLMDSAKHIGKIVLTLEA